MTELYSLPLEKRVLGPMLAERAREHGDRVYLRFDDRSWTFRQIDQDARAVARGLKALSVGKQDTVALLLPNCPEFVLAWYGCCVAGAVFVPVNPTYTGPLLDYIFKDSGSRGVIVDRSLFGQLATVPRETLNQLEWVAVVGGIDGLQLPEGPNRYLSYDQLPVTQGEDPEVPCSFRDVQSIMYTSGTTGPSKGVIIPNGHFFASATTFVRALRLTSDDVLFTPLPLFHGLASRLGVLPALMVGGEVVIAEKFSAGQFWRQAAACGATVGHTIFTLPTILKAQPPSEWDKAHKMRAMYNANYDPEFESRFNVRLVEAYGLTETGLTVYTPWPDRRDGSCGRAHEDFEIALIGDDGLPVPDGEPGELVARPKLPSIMMDGYINKPEETLKSLRNLWFHTGDYARRDADGYFYFVGRKKERIRRRGENISGFEVERIVGMHPEVSEVAAVAHPASVGEDDVRCVIIRSERSSLTPAALMDWLQTRMPRFMLPRYIEFVADMPRTPSAKVEKYKLVEAGLGPTAWDREAAGYRLERATPNTAAPALSKAS
ncbi:AMP-binding protein [Mesorhizobium sp. 1B3]|uniref:AMP-binding protein n=1 Tax=Mesorhizobium sp. 1B3 TaxID=3243599 RepID=UPI003D9883AB